MFSQSWAESFISWKHTAHTLAREDSEDHAAQLHLVKWNWKFSKGLPKSAPRRLNSKPRLCTIWSRKVRKPLTFCKHNPE